MSTSPLDWARAKSVDERTVRRNHKSCSSVNVFARDEAMNLLVPVRKILNDLVIFVYVLEN